MKNLVLVVLFAALMLTGCVVSTGPPGYGGVTVSPLPAVVELGVEPYYYYSGNYYYYHDNSWSYSNTRKGPWTSLPRSHWPKEIRHRDRDGDRDHGRHHDHD